MTTLLFILIIIALTIFSAIADSYVIKKKGNLKGFKKVYNLAGAYALIGIVMISYSISKHDNWHYAFTYIISVAALYSLIKDIAMGLILRKNPFYLGNGWFDSVQKKCPDALRFMLKLTIIFVFFNIHRLFNL